MNLKLHKVTKVYGRKIVLDDISMEVKPHTIYGLLGNNGAGKSTLLNIINNRTRCTMGQVYLRGEVLINNEKLQNKIYLMGEDNLYPSGMKIETLFKWTEEFYGKFDWQLAHRMLEDFSISSFNKMNKLSTGYRSIVKLIVALCVPCDYIFLDEPVLGLDVNHREMFYDYLLETYQSRLRTFVISTHLIEEISNLLEYVIILDQGKVISTESTEEILKEAYVLHGSNEQINYLISDTQVLEKIALGGATTAYIKGNISRKNVRNVKIVSMTLQDYFKKITNGERVSK